LLPLALFCTREFSSKSQQSFASASTIVSVNQAMPLPLQSSDQDETWESAATALPVLLLIEPVGTTVHSDIETPVVFPGYLLPDDNHEEPAHEGS
jgi:hypothetical protein